MKAELGQITKLVSSPSCGGVPFSYIGLFYPSDLTVHFGMNINFLLLYKWALLLIINQELNNQIYSRRSKISLLSCVVKNTSRTSGSLKLFKISNFFACWVVTAFILLMGEIMPYHASLVPFRGSEGSCIWRNALTRRNHILKWDLGAPWSSRRRQHVKGRAGNGQG